MCQNSTRGLFFFFNFLQALTGIAVIVVGSLSLVKGDEFDILYNRIYLVLPAIGVATGILTLVFTSVGCVGAFKEKKSILFLYGSLELVLLLMQITIFVLLFVYAGDIVELIPKWMTDVFMEYHQGNKDLDESLDDVQQALMCCGIHGHEDWKDFNYLGVADGCCKERFDHCGYLYFSDTVPEQLKPDIWDTGCAEVVEVGLSVLLIVLGGVTGAVALLQIICIIFAFILGYQSKKPKSQSIEMLHTMDPTY